MNDNVFTPGEEMVRAYHAREKAPKGRDWQDLSAAEQNVWRRDCATWLNGSLDHENPKSSRGRLIARRAALMDFLQSCVDTKDWHGVRDAAADLEVIEARIEERRNRGHE